MKKVIKEFYVYDYEELEKSAQEKARNEALDRFEFDIRANYEDDIRHGLNAYFPNSDLDFEYSLGYCQGDGFNLYGKLDIIDACEFGYFKCPFRVSEMEDFRQYMDVLGYDSIELPKNETRYSYCYIDQLDFYKDWCYELEELHEPFDKNLILKVQNWIKESISNLCSRLEYKGYRMFYEMTEDKMKKVCDEYDLQFYKNGRIYKGQEKK